ncbi:5-formyltetrahydrofolate cyclo-ligase [Acuticoccus sp. M5D2P5]|uniref:5-formyltetrahydrofolate cyclo-ligase n=1 Tax=Acuticoccus kalidii TaxID=2910977 RepID=UPI001F1625D7|nr:5-formyltetrahydrofolate cyclo-ligase [Acuticoccus kalidii]MCF3933578.1 5-formyltetrahydrofolate cyclo-ligase [Acuticoccus kalidii]
MTVSNASIEKSALRKAALARRAEAAREAGPGAAEAILRHIDLVRGASIVSAYVAMRDEIDPMPLAGALRAAGARLALPAVENKTMTFRAYTPGDPLVDGPFGTRHPTGAIVEPDLLLVPLLAFTRAGARLGYGAGHYDRWLAAHPGAVAIGIAYAAQELAHLPVEPHDQPLKAIITEKDAIMTGESACASSY